MCIGNTDWDYGAVVIEAVYPYVYREHIIP